MNLFENLQNMKKYESPKWLTNKEYKDELDSIDSEYNEVSLTDDEFSDMYRLGYTLGTSETGVYTTAKQSDYDNYKKGLDVNGNEIKRDKDGQAIKVVKENADIKPYGGDGKNWAMFYCHDGDYKYSDIVDYAKSKGFDKEYWGSDEAHSYGFKGMYNGDTTIVFKDANLLPDGYKEDALKYGKLIDENVDLKNENFDKKTILHKIDLFAKQITIDKSNMKDMEELLRSKHIDYQVDADSKPNKVTFYLIYKENINNIKKEAKYNSNISTKDELYTEIQKMLSAGGVDKDSVSLTDLFNCFSIDSLKELYDYISSEYQDDWEYDEELDESTKLLKEDKNSSGYRLFFGNWRTGNGKTFNSEDKLIQFLNNNYVDPDIVITHSEDVTNEFKDFIHKKFHFDVDDKDKRDKLFKIGYVEIDDITESTSGIGAGNYTTQAIDMLPTGVKKVNEVAGKTKKNWSIFADYEFKIDKELAIPKLLEISKDIDNNKYLTDEDKKELKDFITSKCKTLKTEAVTKFYDTEFEDDVIKDKIEFTKSHPQEFMALKYVDPLEYEGTTYYVISEGKEITYDDKQCEVYLLADENLNKYLGYFEITLEEVGDAENGPDLQRDVSNVPYKIVAI